MATTVTMRTQKVTIIGGGISGITTALTLQSLGLDYSLLEKKEDLNYDEVGIGLSANIFPILKHLNVFDKVKLEGVFIEKFHFVNMKGKCLKTFTLKKPALSVNRNTFYKILTDKLDWNKVHLNYLNETDNLDNDGIIVDASGIHSEIRRKVYPTIQLRDSKQYLWRGISKIELPEKFKNAYHDYIGSNLRFAIIHTGANSYSWYLITESIHQKYKKDNSKDDVKRLIESCPKEVQKVVSNSNDIFFSKLLDIDPKSRKKHPWHIKDTIMIGDAIHPTTPNMANGACLSIEDGFLLGNLISQNKSNTEIFAQFERNRKTKVNRVVWQSWLFGKMMHWNSSLMAYLVERFIQLTPQFLFNKIYGVVLDEGKLLPTMYKKH